MIFSVNDVAREKKRVNAPGHELHLRTNLERQSINVQQTANLKS